MLIKPIDDNYTFTMKPYEAEANISAFNNGIKNYTMFSFIQRLKMLDELSPL